MSQSSTPKWPSYAVGPDTHIHALGVVAINYNAMELALAGLLRQYLGASDDAHAYIFQALNLHSQTALFKLCVSQEKNAALRQHLLDFCTFFETCAGNRNLLMHSNLHEAITTDDLLGLAKRSRNKPHVYNDMQLRIEELRGVADEIRTVFIFGTRLWKFVQARKRQDPFRHPDKQTFPMPALPDRPSQPMSLAERFQPTQQKQ